jgi:hypothetical protein
VKDRRAQFFTLAALLCLVLVPLADDKYRELTAGVGAVYLVLALASYLDFRSRR